MPLYNYVYLPKTPVRPAGRTGECKINNWNYHKCPQCNTMTLVRTGESTENKCKKCAKLHARSHGAAASASPSISGSTSESTSYESLIVEYDPLPYYEGGFKKGAIITQTQAEYMCICQSFSDGTILCDKNNHKYQACRDLQGKQTLLPLT